MQIARLFLVGILAISLVAQIQAKSKKLEEVEAEVEEEIKEEKNEGKIAKEKLPDHKNDPFTFVQKFLVGTPQSKILSFPEKILERLFAGYLENGGDAESASGVFPLKKCPFEEPKCNVQDIYRSYDGTCNNLDNGLLGSAFIPLKRYLRPEYGNGVSTLRRAKNGKRLPSARLVSYVTGTKLEDESIESLMHTSWGQFVDHDLDLTAVAKLPQEGTDETVNVVCGDDGCNGKVRHCVPITLSQNDPDFSSKKCLTFVRSEGVPNIKCSLGPRQQLNQISSWIDGSSVYGPNKESADSLRDLSNPSRGRMRITLHPINRRLKPLLPLDVNSTACKVTTDIVKCFKAGDVRANEQTHLATIHTIMVREHNRIEGELHKINQHWGGERLYQETRKIVGAILQRLTYNEYLPAMFSKDQMKKFDLTLLKKGFYKGYDSSVDGSVANVFATSAFRFGHSQIPSTVLRPGPNYNTSAHSTLPMSITFFNPKAIYDVKGEGIDSIIRGLAKQPSDLPNEFLTDQVHAHLFTDSPPHGLGTDLGALNIQRGRDHGLPGYNKWRQFCGLPTLKTFSDLQGAFRNQETVVAMSRVYSHVDDIDLFPAGLAEKPEEGALLGPTFSCILGKQFGQLRQGDRFWHENKGQFTNAQLKEIRKVTLAKIFCTNGDNISTIQKKMMLVPSDKNKFEECSKIKQMNLKKWAEKN